MEILSVVARHNDSVFANFYENTIKKWNIKTINVADKEPPMKTIVEKYNIGIKAMKDNNLMAPNDIIIFAHEDVNVIDGVLIDKLKMLFESKPSVGVMGVIGVDSMAADAKKRGQFIIGSQDEVGKGTHAVIGDVGFFDDALYVDDFFFVARAEIFFKGIEFEGTPDTYIMDFCIKCLENSYKIAVADIMTVHSSKRRADPSYNNTSTEALNFIANKYSSKYSFPISSKDVYSQSTELISVEI